MKKTEFKLEHKNCCNIKMGGSLYNCQIFQFFLLLSLTLSLVITATGCSIVVKSVDRINSVKQTLESGEQAFMRENYQLAESLFRQSINESKNPWDKNRAIYNLACVKLITAQNESQYIEAIDLFNQWEPSRNLPMYYENPQLMITAVLQSNEILKDKDSYDLKEFTVLSDMHDIQEIDSIVKETNLMNTRLDRLLREQDGKIKTLNGIVKKQNEKIKLLNALFKKEAKAREEMLTKKREMDNTIKTLKHQISELERIDQKLQNKRTTE
ncbi:MAG: hypothetical protein HQK70_13120 [Desulfamplus sp.]|nr:hypothetical protein [Desulfamplus sp.]